MQRLQGLLLAALLGALAGCTSKPTLRVSAERSPAANFSAYRTYSWVSEPSESLSERPRAGPDLLNWRIRNAIEKQLVARGYEEAASGRADLSIAYHVRRRDAHTESVEDFIRYRESGGQEGMQEAYTFGYQEGTVIIEVLDAATQRLVWRSTAGPVINPESQQEKVTEAVQSMMAHFPSR
jgi:hypothetical protein